MHRHGGEPGEAEQCWRRILTLSRPQKFASVDQGIYGHLTRRNLAALAKERGDTRGSQRQWRAVLAECPGDREATEKLGRSGNVDIGTIMIADAMITMDKDRADDRT